MAQGGLRPWTAIQALGPLLRVFLESRMEFPIFPFCGPKERSLRMDVNMAVLHVIVLHSIRPLCGHGMPPLLAVTTDQLIRLSLLKTKAHMDTRTGPLLRALALRVHQ
jgi:hypothetical protein